MTRRPHAGRSTARSKLVAVLEQTTSTGKADWSTRWWAGVRPDWYYALSQGLAGTRAQIDVRGAVRGQPPAPASAGSEEDTSLFASNMRDPAQPTSRRSGAALMQGF